MQIVCSDLEGIFTPEIWINVAEKTGIDELKLTTRDIPDYDELMRKRLSILDANDIKLPTITGVIDSMQPLPGAAEFLTWLRERTPVIVLSDTYVEFARPLMAQLGWPTLFCHHLTVDGDGRIQNYNLRQKDMKSKAVRAMKGLNFETIAIGDSYNDITMLQAADHGFLFRPPDSVKDRFPQFPISDTYAELQSKLAAVLD
jgi:phosphoserine/homoserine phosphotransferase